MFVTLKDGEEMSLEKVVGEVKGLLGLKYGEYCALDPFGGKDEVLPRSSR